MVLRSEREIREKLANGWNQYPDMALLAMAGPRMVFDVAAKATLLWVLGELEDTPGEEAPPSSEVGAG
jgi:hypothetical protein